MYKHRVFEYGLNGVPKQTEDVLCARLVPHTTAAL